MPEHAFAESETIKLRPLTLPERMVDEISFLANRNGMTPQELVLKSIRTELAEDQINTETHDHFEKNGSSIKLFAKLPAELNTRLEKRAAKIGKSPNYVIFQALDRMLHREASTQIGPKQSSERDLGW